MRAHRAPGIPCALCYRRVEREEQNSGASRRGNAHVCLIGVTSLPAKRLRQGAQAKLSIGRIIQRLEFSRFVVRREPSLVLFILNPDGTGWSYQTSTPTESEKGSDMRAHRILLGLGMPIAFGIAIQTPTFADEYRGTLEQQMACTPDVFRLCGAAMPDVNRIVACLRQNTPQLSNPCRAVFDSSASVPQQLGPQPRGGIQ